MSNQPDEQGSIEKTLDDMYAGLEEAALLEEESQVIKNADANQKDPSADATA